MRFTDRSSSFAAAVLLVAAGAVVVWHAAAWPISHDEALTYLVYILPPRMILRYGPNNHVLFTWLAKASVSLLGASAFTLRLPTVLAAIGYLLAVGRMVQRHLAGAWRPIAAGLLAWNPLVLDYLVAARGYGLALMLLSWALVLLLDIATADVPPSRRRVRWLGICAGLIPVANLTFAVPTAALLGVAALVLWRWRTWWRLWVELLAWSAVVAVGLLAPYLRQAHPNQFFLGYPTLAASVVDLCRATFTHDSTAPVTLQQVQAEPRGPAAAVWIGVLPLAAGLAACIWAGLSRRRAALAAAGAFTLAVFLIVLAHATVGLPYPVPRTVVWAIPLATLAAVLLLSRANAAVRWVSLGACAVLLGFYLWVHGGTYLRYARYDVSSRRIFEALLADHRRHPLPAPVKIGGSWIYEPATNFYRVTTGATWMQSLDISRSAPPDWTGCAYFLCNPADLPPGFPLPQSTLVAADPISGCHIYRLVR